MLQDIEKAKEQLINIMCSLEKAKEAILCGPVYMWWMYPFENETLYEMDTQEKDKNKAKNDKTKHEMEKIEKVKVNPDKAEAEKSKENTI
nr:hypothetical protein [Tanacetum cinerariifolium]